MSSQAKIAIIADVLGQNSGARAPIRFAQGLSDLGYQIHFLCLDINPDKELELDFQKRGITLRLFRPKALIGKVSLGLEVLNYLNKNNFDLIHVHSPQIHYLSYVFCKTPKLRTYYGTQVDLGLANRGGMIKYIPPGILQGYLKFREGLSLRSVNRNVTISEFLVREAKEFYGIDMQNVYLGVDNLTVESGSKDRDSEEIRILSVSRIVPYKGFHTLIESFKEVCKQQQNIRLDIVGSSPIQEYLDYLNQIKNDKVFIHINPSDKELSNFYNQADIYATADTWVPWSLTPLEASFYKLPLLGLNMGAMPEIIRHNQTGLIAKDNNEFTDSLLKLVENKDLRKKLGEKAYEVVKTFTWEKCMKEYSEIYENFLS